MNKKFRTFTAILAIVAIFFSFTACTKNQKIIGNWKSKTAEIAYVFEDDGKYYYYMSTLKLTGKYKIDDNKISLNLDTTKEGTEYNIKIKGDTLYLYTDKQKPEEGIILEKVEELSMATMDEIIEDLKSNKKDTTTEK